MKLLGFTITRSTTAVKALRAELADRNSPAYQMVAKVARSAATDHFQQLAEDKREAFEADSQFQEWARQRREHDLAQAERVQPAEPEPKPKGNLDPFGNAYPFTFEGGGRVFSSRGQQPQGTQDRAGNAHPDPQ